MNGLLSRLGREAILGERLPRLVGRVHASIHTKLLVAFLSLVVLFIALGAVGLQVLQSADERAEKLINLQRKVSAYRQLQHNTTEQLYAVTSALLINDQRNLDVTLRQLNQFAYDFERAEFVGRDEADLLERIAADYKELIEVGTRSVELVRAGDLQRGRALQLEQAVPLANRLERLSNTLVNKAEADMIASVNESRRAYLTSQRVVIGVALLSVVLVLVLGYAISWSLIGPVKRMDARLRGIAAGEFSEQLALENRDELGDLAENLNRMSTELGRLYREIEAASRHKSEFLANMSHELRTPLNAIIGFSEVLDERMFGELNDKQAQYIRDIHESGRHLLSLINDILDLSKIEAGRMELELKRFHVRAALDNTMTLINERATRRSIKLSAELSDSLGEIVADERKFKQILLNLLSNAVKFTEEGGEIILGAARNADSLEVSVEDTGIGISPEDQQIIFEEFRQVGADRGRVSEGTGLGLTLTKKFVEMHGGTLSVRSEIGKGSIFTFSLPLEPRLEPAKAAELGAQEHVAG